MKRAFFFTALLLFALQPFLRAQTTTVVAPIPVPAPVAFAPGVIPGRWNPAPTVYFTPDGEYVLGYTELEAKVWHMPEGELVYRFNPSMMHDDKTRGVLNYSVRDVLLTPDGRYVYTKGGRGDEILIPVDLQNGEIVENGLVRDSIRNGEYQLKHGIKDIRQAALGIYKKLLYPKTSPLLIKRKSATSFGEGLTMLGLTSSHDFPGEIVVCFSQSFCGTDKFIKQYVKENVKDVRKEQNRSNGCHYYDFHAARFNPASNTAVYLGNILKGFAGIDYNSDVTAIPSPVDDIIFISGYDIKTKQNFQTINTYDGTVLWKPSDVIKGTNTFVGFNDFGFAVFKVLNGNATVAELTYNAVTGKLISQNNFSPALPKNHIYNADWNVQVVINELADRSFSLAIYDARTGKHLTSLTDDAGAKQFATAYGNAYRAWETNIAAAQKAMQDSWDRQKAQFALASQQLNAQKAREDATHSAKYKTCPLCKGTGLWITSGVARAYSKTTFSEGRALDGSRTTIRSTESGKGGYWEHRSACLKCFGKGEILR